jgi:hypothetical protein
MKKINKVHSFWTHDGSILVKERENSNLNKPFVVMNDKTMESNSSKSEWLGQQHVAMMANTGFCYTGQDKIVKCAECKVSVNMKDFGEITLNCHWSLQLQVILSFHHQSNVNIDMIF